jgi:hypothetical protein
VQVLNAVDGEGHAQQVVCDPVALVQVRDAHQGTDEEGDGEVGVILRVEDVLLKNKKKIIGFFCLFCGHNL